jgi:trk system potassium uptake protein TrkA
MKIIVAGIGKIGSAIVQSLVAENHDVLVIDNNPLVVESITNAYDIMGVCGNGADCETLEEADVSSTELFVATTDSDELNMLACFIAKRMGANNTIARIRNPEYNDQSLSFMKEQLGLSLAINPEMLTAVELFNILKLPAAIKAESFSRKNIEMIDLKLPSDSALDGFNLIKMREKYKANYLICAVKRNDEVIIPNGNFILKSSDVISIIAPPTEIIKLLKMLDTNHKQAKSVMILGGSRTAYYLAKMLESIGSTVKIIEKDDKICEEMSNLLPNTVVINADGTEQDVLTEEGLNSIDAFVALTGIDEENILISKFAEMQNVPKVISKVSRNELVSMAEKIGLESIVSPKQLISNILVRYARALENSLGCNVETLYKLMDGKIEALEFIVKADSSVIGIPLKTLKTKKNTLVAGIIRGRKTIIPSGDDIILANDRVIIIAEGEQKLRDLSDILNKE